ncbi:hypothetical protein G6F43_007232 [Rhizopus delemar]|nr:hypothetical protein G6F43_007232 [Rhizopus delemar]
MNPTSNVASHSEYLKYAASSKSSRIYPMLIEKSRDDIHMKEANTKRDYVRYTVQDKVRFFDLKIEKHMTASTAAKHLGIHTQIAYRWGLARRKCILTEEYETTVINFIDANPSATVVEVIELLLKRFHDLKVSRSTVYNVMRNECNLSLKKADFHSIERNSPAKIGERYGWVCKWKNAVMNFLTNCVFLNESAFDINMKRSRA